MPGEPDLFLDRKLGLQGKKELVNFIFCLDQTIEPGRETMFGTSSFRISNLLWAWEELGEEKCIV